MQIYWQAEQQDKRRKGNFSNPLSSSSLSFLRIRKRQMYQKQWCFISLQGYIPGEHAQLLMNDVSEGDCLFSECMHSNLIKPLSLSTDTLDVPSMSLLNTTPSHINKDIKCTFTFRLFTCHLLDPALGASETVSHLITTEPCITYNNLHLHFKWKVRHNETKYPCIIQPVSGRAEIWT